MNGNESQKGQPAEIGEEAAGLWARMNWQEMDRVFNGADDAQPIIIQDEGAEPPCAEEGSMKQSPVFAAAPGLEVEAGIWSLFDWDELGSLVLGDEQALAALEGEKGAGR